LVWVSEEQPNTNNYSSHFDDCASAEQLEEMWAKAKAEKLPMPANKPVFITGNPYFVRKYLCFKDLGYDGSLHGKFLHIKLVNKYSEAEIAKFDWEQKLLEAKIAAEYAAKGLQVYQSARDLTQVENEEAKKGLVVEFTGLWGYEGKRKDFKPELTAEYLYTNLPWKYNAYDDVPVQSKDGSGAMDVFKMNKYVAVFLQAAKDMVNGDRFREHVGFSLQDVEELVTKLAFLRNIGENPIDILGHILPIVHLFRLFYGYNALEVITKPM